MSAPLHMVLFEPEIPPNTGNLARTCAATGCWLHLIHPLGFDTDDKSLKRAGLDYWAGATVREYPGIKMFQDFHEAECPDSRIWYFSTKGDQGPNQVNFHAGDALVFGPETRGLPIEELLLPKEQLVRLPMREGVRSLNLASAATAAVYLALEKLGNPGLT